MNRESYLENKVKAAEEEIKRLQARIYQLQAENAKLSKKVSDYGWMINPDRMGR